MIRKRSKMPQITRKAYHELEAVVRKLENELEVIDQRRAVLEEQRVVLDRQLDLLRCAVNVPYDDCPTAAPDAAHDAREEM